MPTTPRTVRQQVADRIRQEVLAGKYAAGTPLREVELARRYGVSRGPVRDAFLQLSQEGLLVYHAHRGVTVRTPPDSQHRRLIVSLRRQLECYCVRLGLAALDDQGLEEIEQALKGLRLACMSEDIGEIAQSDLAFHEAILWHCGGEDLLPVWRTLCSQMLLTYSRLENYEQIYQEHARIMEGVRTRDVAQTVAALKANIR